MHSLVFLPRGPLMFRENRAFAIGDFARGTDPFPSVFFGSLRTSYLKRRGIDFRRYRDPKPDDREIREDVWQRIGSPSGAGRLRIKGPFPFLEPLSTWFFPPPLNLFRGFRVATPPRGGAPELTDLGECGLRPLDLPKIGGSEARLLDEWLPSAALTTYLLEAVRDEPEVRQFQAWRGSTPYDSLFQSERRLGHMRNPSTGIADEGRLYSFEVLRAGESFTQGRSEQTGWVCAIEGLQDEDLPTGSAHLGGRGRRCEVYPTRMFADLQPVNDALARCCERRKGCFLYLATPALFADGWRPRAIGGLRLVAAAVAKPRAVGGWDLARNRARPTQRLVPSGSVYFYEGEPDGGWSDFLHRFQFQSIADERSEAGFGITFVGAW